MSMLARYIYGFEYWDDPGNLTSGTVTKRCNIPGQLMIFKSGEKRRAQVWVADGCRRILRTKKEVRAHMRALTNREFDHWLNLAIEDLWLQRPEDKK